MGPPRMQSRVMYHEAINGCLISRTTLFLTGAMQPLEIAQHVPKPADRRGLGRNLLRFSPVVCLACRWDDLYAEAFNPSLR